MIAILIVLSLDLRAGRALDRVGWRSRSRSLFAALVAGLALLVACLNVLFRDVEHILDGGAAAVVLPDADPLERVETLPATAQRHHDAARRAALGQPDRAADLRGARRALVGPPAAARPTSSTSSSPPWSRSCSARSSSARSTTGSRSSSDASRQHDPPVVDPRLVARRGERRQAGDVAERLELDAREHRRAEERRARSPGRGPGPARTARARAGRRRSEPPASRSRRRRRRSPRRARRARAPPSRAPARRPAGSVGVRLARARGRPRRRARASGCRAPRTTRGARRRGRRRAGTARAGSARGRRARPCARSPGASGGAASARPVPDDRVVAVVEPVVGEEDPVAPRRSCRRSRARRAPRHGARPAARAAGGAPQRTASGPFDTAG